MNSRRAAPDPRGQVEWALRRLVRWALRPDVQKAVARTGGVELTPAHSWALGIIVQQGPLRHCDLAGELQIDPSTLTPRVRHLVELGLVERVPDSEDKRASLLRATAAGGAAFREFRAAWQALIERATGEMPQRQRRQLAEAMNDLADHLERTGGGT